MREYYKIGEISKIFNIEIPTLRYYDEIGIFKPEKVDKKTGYRYYHIRQFTTISQIITYRQLDIPIKTLKEKLYNSNPEGILMFMDETQDQLREHIRSIEKKLKTTEAMKSMVREAIIKEDDFKIVESPEFYLYTYDIENKIKNVDMLDIKGKLEKLEDEFLELSRFVLIVSEKKFNSDMSRTIINRGLVTKDKFDLSNEYLVLKSRKCLHCYMECKESDFSMKYEEFYKYALRNNFKITDSILEIRVLTYYINDEKIIVKELYFPID